ncbi:MAG: phosphoenolpyruvate--protein phosphotransferase [Burkholderiales bacterium]
MNDPAAIGALSEASGASFTLIGASVSSGIAIGHAHLVTAARLEVPQYELREQDVDAELARFDAAMTQLQAELAELAAGAAPGVAGELNTFVNLHRMLLADSALSKVPRDIIRDTRCNAEWALVQQMESLVEQFESFEDPYLRERKSDVQQAVERLLNALLGSAHTPSGPSHEEDIVVVAHDLSPADMILFKQHKFAGFVTDVGGVTSHTAIVARSLGLPAVVGLHHARGMIRENELLIVDGARGTVIVNPDRQVLAEYQLKKRERELERQKLKRLKTTPAATLDGTFIELHANIELPSDIEGVLDCGAGGIGLFRSEFLFLNRDDLPDEDEQFEAYREVAQAMQGKPVTIRTLDLGADKALTGGDRGGPNPALGLRAIRFCLAEPQLFLTQLRAILRASHFGHVRVLLPMLAHAHEVEAAFVYLAQAKDALSRDGIPYDPNIEVGGMIEVPAAALALSIFLDRLDFLSIGTNDLIQYTLAIDRTDETVAHLYDPMHPAVLQLIANTIRTCNKAGRPIAVCGEMAGELAMTRLLLGFGLRQFSMHSSQVLSIKQQVLRTSLADVAPVAQRILRNIDPAKQHGLLTRLNA